jgi:predicted nucleotidyltransferase
MQTLTSKHGLLRRRYAYLPKDFVEAGDGLLCAVVAEGLESGRVLVSPRYLRGATGALRKLPTAEALQWVRNEYPRWMFHSPSRDVSLCGIPVEEVVRLHRPVDAWRAASNISPILAAVFHQLADTFQPLADELGLTGSHLIEAAGTESDIDLVVYGLENFALVQRLIANAIAAKSDQSENVNDRQPPYALQELSESQWRTAYQRRDFSELTFAEYLWHEQRKRNKFSVAGIKVDVSCVDEPPLAAQHAGLKQGLATIGGRVTDATYAFASPAMWHIDHPTIERILVFTATYVGQAQVGELIEAQGQVEVEPSGRQRLIVGSSREAHHEYLRVAHTIPRQAASSE